MMLMSLGCLELQLEQKSMMKGKNGKSITITHICRYYFTNHEPSSHACLCLCEFLASQRKNMSSSGRDCGDLDSPETRFQADLFLLTMASSQRDLFEDHWLSFAVRVHWLKARHLAFQARQTHSVIRHVDSFLWCIIYMVLDNAQIIRFSCWKKNPSSVQCTGFTLPPAIVKVWCEVGLGDLWKHAKQIMVCFVVNILQRPEGALRKPTNLFKYTQRNPRDPEDTDPETQKHLTAVKNMLQTKTWYRLNI